MAGYKGLREQAVQDDQTDREITAQFAAIMLAAVDAELEKTDAELKLSNPDANGLIASANENFNPLSSIQSRGEQQAAIQGPTQVVNIGKSDVWLKPENNNAAPVLLKAGEKTSMNIDGATHPNYPGKVFKVNGAAGIIGVTISDNGVFLNSHGANLINKLGGGGWKDQNWLNEIHNNKDFGWDAIFQKSNEQ